MNNKIPEKIYPLIKKLVKETVEDFMVIIHDPNKKGEGYLGEMFFISLQNKTSGKEYHFIVKQAFADLTIRTSHPIREAFANEILFYSKIWPRLQQFQEELLPAKIFNKFPKCLATISEINSEKLVFENLKYQGFEMFDKKKPFDREHVEFILKEYGKFHGVSAAYRALEPEGYLELTEELIDVFRVFSGHKNFGDFIKNTHQLCLASLKVGKDDDVIEKYKRYVEDGVKIFQESCIYEGNYPLLIHGDCWSNNMMFKYNDAKQLTDIRLLDLQITKSGSPVCDLAYCLYSGASKEILDDLNYYLEIYHDSLSTTIRKLGGDPEKLYPFKVLKNDWKKHCKMGFTMGLLLWKGKLTYEEHAVDLTDMDGDKEFVDQYFEAKFDEETFKRRTRDLILHLYENNYL